MKTKLTSIIYAAAAVLVIAVLVLSQVGTVSAAASDRRGPATPGGTAPRSTAVTATPLSDAEAAALQDAVLEEYGALNLYTGIMDQFGNVAPFSLIARSEQQHVNALVRQAQKYGVTVPANPGLTAETDFATIADACAAGVDAEIADAALYDTLKPVTTHTDLLQVYNSLQSASLNKHLPAF